MNSPSENPSVDDAPILHVDLDAFFASVEILDDPTLRGKPVAVGGGGARGVVASASYEARRYGVRSAMPSVIARRRCPNLIILPGRFDRYEAYSRRFHDIVRDLTPEFEPLGLDEVFANLSSLRRLNVRPIEAAAELRRRIIDRTRTRSAASDSGATSSSRSWPPRSPSRPSSTGNSSTAPASCGSAPRSRQQWLNELPVRALWGVGPATAAKLQKLGLHWVRDLAKVDESTLAAHVGASMASTLVAYAHGEDKREVTVDRVLKSVGHDQTFATSLSGIDEIIEAARTTAVGRRASPARSESGRAHDNGHRSLR